MKRQFAKSDPDHDDRHPYSREEEVVQRHYVSTLLNLFGMREQITLVLSPIY